MFPLLVALLSILASPSKPEPAELHAIYLSVCEIDHRDKGSTAEINIKVFENDIRDAFKNMFSIYPDFEDPDAAKKYGENALAYFHKYLKVLINGNPVKLKFESLEMNGDSVWFYLSFDSKSDWQSVQVTADYLMELFPDQSNVVSIYHGTDKKFLRITRESKSQETSFLN